MVHVDEIARVRRLVAARDLLKAAPRSVDLVALQIVADLIDERDRARDVACRLEQELHLCLVLGDPAQDRDDACS